MIIRAATMADAPALADIYGDACLHGFGTFEEAPPSAEEMAARWRNITARGLPYLVAEEGDRLLGFAYAGVFRPRASYRFTVEDSVYVAPDAKGRGVGRAVLSGVLDACEALGVRQVMAVIGDSGNEGSVGLHTALGFEHAGVGRSLGFKHGRWVDIIWMQKALNGGDTVPPTGAGIRVD
jgi:phosphinothricin acetyltransferase